MSFGSHYDFGMKRKEVNFDAFFHSNSFYQKYNTVIIFIICIKLMIANRNGIDVIKP